MRRACVLCLAVLVSVGSGSAEVRINEVYVNPPGSDDDREFIELVSSTGGAEMLTGISLLYIEGDAGQNPGNVNEAWDLGLLNTGANGLVLLGDKYDDSPTGGPWSSMLPAGAAVGDPSGLGDGDLDNGSMTLLLVSAFQGSKDDDLDLNDNGAFDVTPWTAVIDGVGWRDGDAGDLIYSAADLTQAGYTADAASRFLGDMDAGSAGSWYGGEIAGAATSTTYDSADGFNLPAGAVITPGGPNLAPEPATFSLLAGFALALRRRRRTI